LLRNVLQEFERFYTSFSDFTQGAPHINKKELLVLAGILLVLVLFEEQQKQQNAFYTTMVLPMGKNIVGEP
jgi:uncharacterized membrane protein SirB2